MKTKIVLLGLLMASAVAASLQAAPSQPGATGRAPTGEYSQWAQAPTQSKRHPTCICVVNGYTFCMDATKCAKCAGECSW
ncbi:MAG: hypothetical protein ISP49_18390 [Reyranella sp.]|nr:hypothetical protein [Reyranella sp.]MBL6653570.1 hypothetical protein [Reyranella sp.]